ncbi:MAG: tRNA (adenosine(37)-N6)-threonylcarbamoyltransferase complex dimerization subunit type 1 TsaB [Acidobacteriota bacterium]|nr:tRNA (adenosine(37)-N6)-threonylcarbamoyltransferase complex dimerization subunit type 1 TsaB [Acidobacteriota bacterium]
MLIVAVDTSGRKGSTALCRGDAGGFEVLQLASLEHGTYSAQLMPLIAQVLRQQQLGKADVDGFVVVSGPGSFTGLRVGLATVKGLCEPLSKPLATVSMLEAIAIAYGRFGETVTALLDAGRGEVYVGEYKLGDGSAEKIRESIAKLAQLGDLLASQGRVFTPDTRIAEVAGTGSGVQLAEPVLADVIGHIGLRKLLAGEETDLATADVNYIRRSDAEVFASPKR